MNKKKRTYSEHEKYIYNWVIESMKSFIGWEEEGEEAGFTASCVLVEEKNINISVPSLTAERSPASSSPSAWQVLCEKFQLKFPL